MKKKFKFITSIIIVSIILYNVVFASNIKTYYINSEYNKSNINHTSKQADKEELSTFEVFKKLFDNLYGKSTTFQMNISDEERKNNDIAICTFIVFLIGYWIFLLLRFEKEKYITYEVCDDLEILHKYNPLLAGCIVDNREVLSRDLLAVLINLINKEVINLEAVPLQYTGNSVDQNKKYKYILTRVKENEHKMDRIEAYIHGIFFNHSYNNGNKIRLDETLEELNKDRTLNNKVKHINNIATEELHKIGANIRTVPVALQILNYFLLFVSILLGIFHFVNNSLFIRIDGSTIFVVIVILLFLIFCLPLIVLAFQMFLLLINYIKRLINKVNERYSAQKILSTSIAIWLLIITLIIVSYIFFKDYVMVLDILIIGLAFLIVRTDHLMTKNNDNILSDYYNLNNIKHRIEEYSLLDEKNVQFITLWEEYLAYAISFGFSKPIMDKLRKTYDDDFNIQKFTQLDTFFDVFVEHFKFMFDIDLSLDKYFENQPKKENTDNSHYFYSDDLIDNRSDLEFWFNIKRK